jgi:hypothetical protein
MNFETISQSLPLGFVAALSIGTAVICAVVNEICYSIRSNKDWRNKLREHLNKTKDDWSVPPDVYDVSNDMDRMMSKLHCKTCDGSGMLQVDKRDNNGLSIMLCPRCYPEG